MDTGDPAPGRDWRQAFGQYETQKTAHLARYEGDRDFPAYNFFSADIGMAHAQRAQVMAWLARLWLVTMALLLLAGSGLVARRTPDYRGKAGLRAVWLLLTSPTTHHTLRPARAADWLTGVVLPFSLIALCYLTFTSFLSLQYALLTLVMLGVFVQLVPAELAPAAAAADAMAGGAGGGAGGGAAAAHRPVDSRGGCPRARLFLAQLLDERSRAHTIRDAEHGSDRVDVFLLYAVQRASLNRGVLRALGNLLLAVGAVLVALGLFPALASLEKTLTAINDEMAVLPLGLSRILGITIHLGIPLELPIDLMAAGMVFLALGGLLLGAAWLTRRKARG